MRTFIALEIDEAIRKKLIEVQTRGWIQGRAVRWVKPDRMHLTIKFLGEIDPQTVPLVTQAIESASLAIKPFDIQIRGLGFFPNPKNPRVFWAGIQDGSGSLAGFQSRLEEGLSELGFDPENRAFKPHLTLARFKGKADHLQYPTEALQEAFGSQIVKEVVLFESELRPQGPRYTPLSLVALKE